MMRAAAFAAILAVAGLTPALAQTTNSTSGVVGSVSQSNGYPSGGGAVSLPSVQTSAVQSTSAGTTTTTTTTSTTATTTTTGTGTGTTSSAAGTTSFSTGSSGSSGGAATSAGGARSTSGSGASGGTHWVVCPPSGTGVAPLFTGTDLSCAPD